MAYITKEIKDVLHGAIEKWGINSQLGMLMEESFEMVNAFATSEIYPNDKECYLNILGEIADVFIMVQQIKFSFYGDEIKRLKGLINIEYNYYGVFEHRKRLCYHASNIGLQIRKKLSRPDKEFSLHYLLNEIARLDIILDCLKQGDSVGVSTEPNQLKELYLDRIEKVSKRVFN